MRSVDYQYNELNQLIYREDSQNQEYTYTYDKRGNRVAEAGKKESRAFVYDETNRLVEGTNWKGDKSSYTYNGLGVRINNTQTSHSGSVYSRDYVIDYTSLELTYDVWGVPEALIRARMAEAGIRNMEAYIRKMALSG